jgi:rhamnosyltransferase
MRSVLAIVVWFHPTREDALNLQSLVALLDGVIVVDNSMSPNEHLLPSARSATYLWDGDNKGIAKALNIGCYQAIAQGAGWLLTMDQDSAFEEAHLRRLLDKAAEAEDDVGIVGPNWHGAAAIPGQELVECDSSINSGSLVRAAAFLRIGGYNEDLFLDEVDHEFGYRLRRAGYRILRMQSVSMRHQVGTPMTGRVLWRTVKSTNHSPVRKYYMTRSRLYMRKYFPEFGSPYLEMIVTDALKVLLVEGQKARKLYFMVRGVIDHFRGIRGKVRFEDSP